MKCNFKINAFKGFEMLAEFGKLGNLGENQTKQTNLPTELEFRKHLIMTFNTGLDHKTWVINNCL